MEDKVYAKYLGHKSFSGNQTIFRRLELEHHLIPQNYYRVKDAEEYAGRIYINVTNIPASVDSEPFEFYLKQDNNYIPSDKTNLVTSPKTLTKK